MYVNHQSKRAIEKGSRTNGQEIDGLRVAYLQNRPIQ